MRVKICIFATVSILSFLSLDLLAQDDKRKQKPSVNTKKETPVKVIEYIVGTWRVKEIKKGNKSIARTDTIALDQTIVLNREGRYVSHSGNEKIDSGAYRLNENHAILYLESEANDQTTQWNIIRFKRNEMTLKRRNAMEKDDYTFVYARIRKLRIEDN